MRQETIEKGVELIKERDKLKIDLKDIPRATSIRFVSDGGTHLLNISNKKDIFGTLFNLAKVDLEYRIAEVEKQLAELDDKTIPPKEQEEIEIS